MIFLIVFIVFGSTRSEYTPILPEHFTVEYFEEIYWRFPLPVHIKGEWDGSRLYYDSTLKSERTDMPFNNVDQLCETNKKGNNYTCTVLITQGVRYVIYPEINECCYCCDDSNGCGFLERNWLEGGSYYGEKVYEGKTCQGYVKKGFSENYYFLHNTTNVPCALVMGDLEESKSLNTYIYHQGTFDDSPIPSSVFDIPSSCKSEDRNTIKKCDGWCEFLRNKE